MERGEKMVYTYVYTRKCYSIGRAKAAACGNVGVDIYAGMCIMRGTQTSHKYYTHKFYNDYFQQIGTNF